MSNKTGGPAFPQSIDLGDEVQWFKGMTLRDYFAAKAMQGWLANSKTSYDATYEHLAEIFYAMADAMLKAREQ